MKFILFGLLVSFIVVAKGIHGEEPMEDEEMVDVLRRVRRIIGGTEVEEGDYPWLVHLKGRVPRKLFWGIWPRDIQEYSCTGSILNNRWILTAAHCFHVKGAPSRILTPKYWKITAGSVSLTQTRSIWGRRLSSPESIQAEKIVIYPGYSTNDGWRNDIAVVKLSSGLSTGSDAISPVTLPDVARSKDLWPPVGTNCVVKGWGCTQNGGSQSDVAREVRVPVLSNGICNNMYRDITMTPSKLCAGHMYDDKGICPGDSGGPLVCKVGSTWIQAGVASLTSERNPEDVPVIFTRVAAYTAWIKSEVGYLRQD